MTIPPMMDFALPMGAASSAAIQSPSPAPTSEPIAELTQILRQLNDLRRQGVPVRKLDEYTQREVGMSYKEFGRRVGEMRERPEVISDATSEDLFRMELYGLTLGWLDEIEGLVGKVRGKGSYKDMRDKARAKITAFEKEHPHLARWFKLYGAGTGLLAGGVAVQGQLGAGGLLGGAGVSDAAMTGALTGMAGAQGAAAGAGGLIDGENQGTGRIGPALEGGAALAGGAALGGLLAPTSMMPAAADATKAGLLQRAKNAPLPLKAAGAYGAWETLQKLRRGARNPLDFLGE